MEGKGEMLTFPVKNEVSFGYKDFACFNHFIKNAFYAFSSNPQKAGKAVLAIKRMAHLSSKADGPDSPNSSADGRYC